LLLSLSQIDDLQAVKAQGGELNAEQQAKITSRPKLHKEERSLDSQLQALEKTRALANNNKDAAAADGDGPEQGISAASDDRNAPIIPVPTVPVQEITHSGGEAWGAHDLLDTWHTAGTKQQAPPARAKPAPQPHAKQESKIPPPSMEAMPAGPASCQTPELEITPECQDAKQHDAQPSQHQQHQPEAEEVKKTQEPKKIQQPQQQPAAEVKKTQPTPQQQPQQAPPQKQTQQAAQKQPEEPKYRKGWRGGGFVARKMNGTHRNAVTCLYIVPNKSRLISGGLDNTIQEWNLATGSHIRSLGGHTKAIEAVWGDADYSVSASDDGSVRYWRASDGKMVRNLYCYAPVKCMALQGDMLLTGHSDGTVRIYEAGPSGSDTARTVLRGHTGALTTISIMQVGKYAVSTARDSSARVWDLARGVAVHVCWCGLECAHVIHMMARCGHAHGVCNVCVRAVILDAPKMHMSLSISYMLIRFFLVTYVCLLYNKKHLPECVACVHALFMHSRPPKNER
jgi:hypothetical protein